jgi:hypothetical protein
MTFQLGDVAEADQKVYIYNYTEYWEVSKKNKNMW